MSAPAERLLLPGEVAAMFRVDVKTVTRWAKDGRLTAIRTLGGHRRYREAEVRALLDGSRSGTCPDCRYLLSSPGHKATCGSAS